MCSVRKVTFTKNYFLLFICAFSVLYFSSLSFSLLSIHICNICYLISVNLYCFCLLSLFFLCILFCCSPLCQSCRKCTDSSERYFGIKWQRRDQPGGRARAKERERERERDRETRTSYLKRVRIIWCDKDGIRE